MSRRTKVRGAAVAVAMAAAGTAVTALPAAAASDGPRFLAPADLPPHPSSEWFAGEVTAGQPDPLPMCVGEALPSTSVHRAFYTDLDTNALQVTVVERSTRRAADFAALVRKKLQSCAATVMKENPDITATQKYYGRVAVEDGAHVYGVHTEATWGATDINLFSVGRDGTAVTIVKWGQMGGYDSAPVAAFKKTTATAVRKLQ
ncbi:hypothetical protein OKJ48_29695 [Streptomyces kunmingensis]|uniref:PknH-like extracellular domain-containing protein n=1 Tax=Streptomyces kunmingensis TaxID=68225 RepID=A0ABU6CIC2_9ACTN|nr:hypothetical protein [Streptomyces kunmingensis]MEB3964377.1 hypothetical protein [Streptomyces kunmingensis]